VKDVLVYRPEVKEQQLQRLEETLAAIASLRARPDMSPEDKKLALTQPGGAGLSPFAAQVALDLTEEEWQRVVDQGRSTLEAILATEIAPADIPARRGEIRQRLDPSLTADQALLLEELLSPLIVPTLAVDPEKTRERREAARAQVAPVQVSLTKGQVIVAKGDIIEADDLEALREAGLLSSRLRPDEVASVALVALLASLALALSLRLFPPGEEAPERRLGALLLVMVLWTLAARFYLGAVLPDVQGRYLAYLLPIAAAPMLVASLLGTPIGVVAAALMAFLATYAAFYLPGAQGLAPGDVLQAIQMLAVFLTAGLVGVFAIHRAERTSRYLLAGLMVAVASFLALLAFWLLGPSGRLAEVGWMAMARGVGGMFSAMLTLAGLIFLGLLLGITTRFQLLELAQLNHPLLRRLQAEAPGTFHHSVLVGNLAEGAAHAIGADALLVRVGSYYHDIGKVVQPGFYIENQLGGDNPHAQLAPQESAAIIRHHVEQGVELARRHRLPSAVLAFIQEHHGTRLVTYFYRQASQENPQVDPAPFAYPGPKPKSRESALIMLADSVEAVVRSSADRSPETMDRLVEGVIAERLSEGQLDDCDLTLRELKVIAEQFKASLRGLYHPRIDYPAPTEAERRGALSPLFRAPPVPVDGTAPPGPIAPGRRQEL